MSFSQLRIIHVLNALSLIGHNQIFSNSNDHSAVLGVDDVGGEVVQGSSNNELEMDLDVPNVTMKVLDGIVVGTKVYLI